MDTRLEVLDLFSGLGGWSAPFRDRGHKVTTLDVEPSFEPDIVADLLTWEPDASYRPDIILASPPCETFSMLAIGKGWTKDGQPRTEQAAKALKLVERTLELASLWPDAFLVVENPRARLRTLPTGLMDLERVTVTYCQYGERVMKPTDLWGRFPQSLAFRPPCRNGASCHVRAPRGSTSGTQGPGTSAERARIPYQLAQDVCKAAERDQGTSPVASRLPY
jgi:hypothetical protein